MLTIYNIPDSKVRGDHLGLTGPMLAPWTFLSGILDICDLLLTFIEIKYVKSCVMANCTICHQWVKSHCGDKIILWSCYLHKGFYYTDWIIFYIESGPRTLDYWLINYCFIANLSVYLPFCQTYNHILGKYTHKYVAVLTIPTTMVHDCC